ncbi:MAG: phosphatidate cytidylyltransferase [Ginsengibacter sp.]
MAFDSKTFKTRALTSVVFVLIMLAGLLWNRWTFIVLFTVIHFGCWYDFVKMVKKIYPLSYKYVSLYGIFYITLPIISLLYVRLDTRITNEEDLLKVIPCGIIFSIWINDTMAYITGSFFGKTPFSVISPKKTWEGTIGGALLCVTAIALIGNATGFYSFTTWIVIASCCAVFGTLGDLLESKLKRMANVKDSGTLMPGHGGFLDRFDSLLIATPFVAAYYYFFI